MDKRCPHYLKFLLSFCRADGKVYAPNYLEQQEYCKSGDYSSCPLFKRALKESAAEEDR